MKWFFSLSIRNKLIFIILAVSLIIVTLVGGARMAWDAHQARQTLAKELSVLTELLGDRSSAALAFDDDRLAKKNLASLHVMKHVVQSCLYRNDNSVLAFYQRENAVEVVCPVVDQFNNARFSFEENRLHIVIPIQHDDEILGWIYLGSDLSPIAEKLRDQLTFSIIAFLAAIFITLVLAGWVQRVISGPIVEITRVARAIEDETGKDLRAPVSNNDEVGQLAKTFNSMLDTLETKNTQLISARDEQILASARYRNLVESTSAIPWELDLSTWRFTYVGPQAVKIFGYPVETWYQENFWADHLHPDDVESSIAYCEAATKEIRDHQFDYRMRSADGRYVWVHDDVQVVVKDGKPVKLHGFLFDISELKQAQQSLQENEEKYRGLFEHASDAIYLIDPETTKIVDCNDKAAQMSGYTCDELRGASVTSLHPDNEVAAVPKVFNELARKGALTGVMGFHHQAKDGRLVDVELSATVIEIGGKKLSLAVARDVTERLRTEDAIKNIATGVSGRAGATFFPHLVLQLAKLFDADYVFIGLVEPENMVSVNTLVVCSHGEIVDNMTYALRDTPCSNVLNEKVCTYPSEVQSLFPKDKMLEDMGVESYIGTPLYNEKGEPIGLIVVLDSKPMQNTEYVTEILQIFSARASAEIERSQADALLHKAHEELELHRDNLEETVQERTAELEAMNAELESFSYSVSHDLRAPLRSISSFSQLIREDYGTSLDEEGQDFLERVIDNAHRMSELIDDLLELSRLGRKELKTESVNLDDLVSEVVSALHDNSPYEVEFNSSVLGEVVADRRLIKVVFENILSNAWKYTSKSSNAMVTVGKEKKDGETVFFFRDNGAGFDMAYVDKIFGAFQRLHNNTEFEGTGIGLATVKRIVSRHGGQIWVDAEVGKGATFYLMLPK